MSIGEDAGKFAAWLEQRGVENERKLKVTHSDDRRLLLKTEAAELHVIQVQFDEMLAKHLPRRQERQESAAP